MAGDRERVFAIRQISINDAAWTDVQGPDYLPIDCNMVIIFNGTGVDIHLRTDPNNASSETTIATGQQYEIGTHRWGSQGNAPRFPKIVQDAVCALKSSNGVVTPLVEALL